MASTIKVDNIQDQCGSAVVTKCGASKTLTVTTTKADNYQAADGGNIINQSGTTITLGASGDTISLAAGASQTGFGRTGTVDWDTTAKTASFTAVSGNGYFVNTSSGAITVTLPASPSAGDIVSISDYARTFATNNVTIGRNGSLIQGSAFDGTISTNGQSTTFVYVDGTKGWVPTEDQTTNNYGFNPLYVAATGGTVTCCGDYKIHTFTGPGTFTVTCAGNSCGSNTVDYLVVAGGGSANAEFAAGGAGGYRESSGAASGCYTASPLGAGVSALPVTASPYPITVGAGGGSPTPTSGSNSIFSTITSAGGGNGTSTAGTAGGSGAGGAAEPAPCNAKGTGNTPPVSPPQGFPGGDGANCGGAPTRGGGGGGGATAAGTNGTPTSGGNGGDGATSSINGTPTARAGGGGAGPGGAGGAGGGGNASGGSGTANTGGGGASWGRPVGGAAGAGGSGIVIIRYKYQ